MTLFRRSRTEWLTTSPRIGPVLLLVGLTAGTAARADLTADLCHAAAAEASAATSVPVEILTAIMLTETGRTMEGRLEPWPWTINTGDAGHWFPDRETALRFAEDLLQSGRTSFDIGCFQINFRWHGGAFTSIEQMFDPDANARYAAEFLTSLMDDSGDWSIAAGAYHSRTPALAERYRSRFDTILADLGARPPTRPREAPATGGYDHPLLQSREGSRTPGSLVPLSVVPST